MAAVDRRGGPRLTLETSGEARCRGSGPLLLALGKWSGSDTRVCEQPFPRLPVANEGVRSSN